MGRLNTCEKFLQTIIVICILQSREVRFRCIKESKINLRGNKAEIRVSFLLHRKLQEPCHKEFWIDSDPSAAIFLRSESEMLLLNCIIRKNRTRHSQTLL
jgi:hypothetical protein